MCAANTTNTDLQWDVLTIKRPGLSRDLPAGKEELMWVANSSTCLHVPSIGLIVGGDAVYNGIHPYLGETDTQSRIEWISTLDKLEALKPKAVVAGHKVPGNDDDPRIIAETRQYLRDFNRLNTATTTARELYDAMLQIYPARANPGSLWGAANIAKKQAPNKNGQRQSVSPGYRSTDLGALERWNP